MTPDLAAALQAGNVEAFRECFDREAGRLVRYATHLLGSREDAEDAVQEAFFRLWRDRLRLRPNADPARLLYTIVRNLGRDLIRHRLITERPHPYFLVPEMVEQEGGPEELQSMVQGALQTLSARQREIVVLRWRHHRTYEAIGAELGISPSTASAHMQRAIAQLKRRLSTTEVTTAEKSPCA